MATEKTLMECFGIGTEAEDYEVRSTKGIEKNMHDEIKNLVRKAFNEGFNKGKEVNAMTDEDLAEIRGEGVLAIWDKLNELLDEKFLDPEPEKGKKVYSIDPNEFAEFVIDTLAMCPFELLGVECECDGCEEEEEPINVGDVVTDPVGNKCTVTNTDTHIHVVYENGKTHKWSKDANFTKIGEAAIGKVIGVGKVKIGFKDEVGF